MRRFSVLFLIASFPAVAAACASLVGFPDVPNAGADAGLEAGEVPPLDASGANDATAMAADGGTPAPDAEGPPDAGAGDAGDGGGPPPDCTDCTPTELTTTGVGIGLAARSPLLFFDYVDDAGANSPLCSIPHNGGKVSPLTLAPVTATNLLADQSYVYGIFHGGSGVVARLPIVGGGMAFDPIDGSVSYMTKICVNSTYVFALWALSEQHVDRFLKTGGGDQRVADNYQSSWIDFDVDEQNVYLTTGSVVSSAAADRSDAGVLGTSDPGETITAISAGGNEVVFLSNTRVGAFPKAGGDAITLSAGTSAYALTADDTNAYFFRATRDGGDCSVGSELYEVPLTGGHARHLATDPGCVSLLVQDTQGLYWFGNGNRTIRSALK